MEPKTPRLELLAANQSVHDQEVASCWELIRKAIQSQRLARSNLDRLIDALRAGDGIGLDELNIEPAPAGSDHLIVEILEDRRTCSVAKMVVELERLRARVDGATGDEPPPADGPSELDLLDVLAGFLGTTPARLAGDPEAYRAHVERIRAATTAFATTIQDPASDEASRAAAASRLRQLLAESAQAGAGTARQRAVDLTGALHALGIDLEYLVGPLRTITEWLEHRTPEAGAAVDHWITALEAAAEPLLGEQRQRREAERDARIRDSARAAIAARLGRKS
jgi:hypothetical protein